MEVLVSSLGDLKEEVWDSLLHLSTCPVPFLTPMDPDLAAKGLSTLGVY